MAMTTNKGRGLVMVLAGFSILIYSAAGYISGRFEALPALTILGLIFVAIGSKFWRSED